MTTPQRVPCPQVTITAALNTGTAQLIGWNEFGTLSIPPVLYRGYTTSGGWNWIRSSSTPNWTVAVSGMASTYAFDATTGLLNTAGVDGTSVATNIGYTLGDDFTYTHAFEAGGYLNNGAVTPSADGLNGTDIPDNLTLSSGTVSLLTINSKTQMTWGVPTWTGGTPPDNAMTGADWVTTLTNPDTDADAITRAIAGAAGGSSTPTTPTAGPAISAIQAAITSLIETRAATATSMLFVSGTYVFNVLGVLEIPMKLLCQWQRRTAQADGLGGTSLYGSTWADADLIEVDFTATGWTYTSSSLTIPSASGYQYRIKSITCVPTAACA